MTQEIIRGVASSTLYFIHEQVDRSMILTYAFGDGSRDVDPEPEF